MHQLLLNKDIYDHFVSRHVAAAEKFLWIVTADIKNMHIEFGGEFMPLLELLAERVNSGVAVRLIHAREPGPRFRKEFDRFPQLLDTELFERILCPRVHTKCIVIDGRIAYLGSANLTGAGMGARHKDKRNFEAGILFDDVSQIQSLMNWVDQLYLGDYCVDCRLRSICPDPVI